eukprot:g4048.t1
MSSSSAKKYQVLPDIEPDPSEKEKDQEIVTNVPEKASVLEEKSEINNESNDQVSEQKEITTTTDEPKQENKEQKNESTEQDKDTKSNDDGSGPKEDDDDDDDDEFTWEVPECHLEAGDEKILLVGGENAKLLFLISRYATQATGANDKEGWIREIPLTVVAYEAIVAGVLDFDYAPMSKLVCHEGRSRRLWLNCSQEAKSSIDELREMKLVNGLKLSTEDFQPITAFQVSSRGVAFLKECKEIPSNYFDEMLATLYHPATSRSPTDMVEVSFNGEEGLFHISNKNGFSRESGVTETEDVSYVSSPYLPVCIRASNKPLTDNHARRFESASGSNNIQDELDEAVILDDVRLCVGEWIPFGANQVVALNEKLGALDRCQGGFFTSMIDKDPTTASFSCDPGLTSIKILDFDFVRFINFEAEINYPEEEGIVQVEEFGMHLNVDGTMIYGMKIEAIMDRLKDDVSVDLLSRVLVDVHQDSSEIVNDVLSPYQISLLDMIFCGDMMNRGKFNLLLAQDLKPHLKASEYMNRGDRENELKQVLGDFEKAVDIGHEGDILLLGRQGILFAGKNSLKHEYLLLSYLSLITKEMFIRNFFTRTFMLDDDINKLRKLIANYIKDPTNIKVIGERLSSANREIILLQETLGYLADSMEAYKVPPCPIDGSGKALYKELNLDKRQGDLQVRIHDLKKLIAGANSKLAILQQQSNTVNTKQLESVCTNIDDNYRALVGALVFERKSQVSTDVMQYIFGASFAVDIIDRITGDAWLGALGVRAGNNTGAWVNTMIRNTIIVHPMLWFFLNMVWLGAFCLGLQRLMNYLAENAMDAKTVRITIKRRVDIKALESMIRGENLLTWDSVEADGQVVSKAAWEEGNEEFWKGLPPTIIISYDRTNEWLLTAFISWSGKFNKNSQEEIASLFNKRLLL